MDLDSSRVAVENHVAHLNESLKWVVASAGAVAAVIVTSLQLQAPRLGAGAAAAFWLAAIAAIGSALALLLAAVSVLCTQRLTCADLARREVRANRLSGKPPVGGDTDAMVSWVQDEGGPTLLGSASSVTELIQRTQRGTDEQRAESLGRLQLIESSLHLHRVQRALRSIRLWGFSGAAVFALGVAGLATVPAFGMAQEQVPVNEPVRVDVSVVDPNATDIPPKCGEQLRGVAIGGTWDDPRLALMGTPTCEPMELEHSDGLVVTPR